MLTLHACREDTWSLGVCNGCQLMALLGWVPGTADGATGMLPDEKQPRFIHNKSGRFESRWSTVTVQESPAIMLKVGLRLSNALNVILQATATH